MNCGLSYSNSGIQVTQQNVDTLTVHACGSSFQLVDLHLLPCHLHSICLPLCYCYSFHYSTLLAKLNTGLAQFRLLNVL